MMQAQHPPLFLSKVSAGFPSPAEDYKDKPLCLNERLVERPAATLFIHLADNGMVGDHYHPCDLLIVDKSVTPRDGSVVVANVAGDLMIRRLVIRGRSGWRRILRDRLNPAGHQRACVDSNEFWL